MRKNKLVGLVMILSIFSAQSQAEERHNKLWRVSAALLGAVTIADIQSSVGRQEANPLLASQNGQFNGRGVALKGAAVGAMLGVQWLMLRKNPHAAKYATGANFAAAALTGTIVIHNHMVK
jgi:ferric-dicitrate binding protein FerR (iron transport regulator)